MSILKIGCCESLFYFYISVPNADFIVSAKARFNTLDKSSEQFSTRADFVEEKYVIRLRTAKRTIKI
jgi:hypothetical protein